MELSRKSLLKFTFYRDASGQWRWRLKSRNGSVVAKSDSGYQRHANAVKSARILTVLIAGAEVAA